MKYSKYLKGGYVNVPGVKKDIGLVIVDGYRRPKPNGKLVKGYVRKGRKVTASGALLAAQGVPQVAIRWVKKHLANSRKELIDSRRERIVQRSFKKATILARRGDREANEAAELARRAAFKADKVAKIQARRAMANFINAIPE